jgi:hypothetical protein
VIGVLGENIVEWSGCSIEEEPTAGEIAAAEDEYQAYLDAIALGDPTDPRQWREWEAPDLDTGTEVLVEWDAPAVNAAWEINGTLSQAGNLIKFKAALALLCTTDEYSVVQREVALSVEHTAPRGSAADVTWVDENDALYADYDAATGKVGLRARFASDNWAGKGQWQRVTLT